MDHDLICTWLGLPAKNWPPDHYTLLGLPPGEADCVRIEQQIHERLARVKAYQLSHPGPATEAMNRLAQAYVCLTDRKAKHAYDAEHFPHLAARPDTHAPRTLATDKARDSSGMDTAVLRPVHTQVDWRNAAPPPVRATPPQGEAPLTPAAEAGAVTALPAPPAEEAQPAPPAPPAQVPQSRTTDPVFELAHTSPEARRGLGTRRALYQRILTTRQLLRAWNRANKYLARPKRKLARQGEEADLTRLLNHIDQLLADFPPLLGEPGKPGYRVVALVTDNDTVGAFNRLDEAQRAALALDWAAGQALLLAHRHFLLRQTKRLRRSGRLGRVARMINAALHDHPGWASLGLLALIGAAVAVILVS